MSFHSTTSFRAHMSITLCAGTFARARHVCHLALILNFAVQSGVAIHSEKPLHNGRVAAFDEGLQPLTAGPMRLDEVMQPSPSPALLRREDKAAPAMSSMVELGSQSAVESVPEVRWYDSKSGWSMGSFFDAEKFCDDKGLRVAHFDQICPQSAATNVRSVFQGAKGGIQWAPFGGSIENAWVQIGAGDGSSSATCRAFHVTATNTNSHAYPSWGTSSTPKFFKKYIACSTKVSTCVDVNCWYHEFTGSCYKRSQLDECAGQSEQRLIDSEDGWCHEGARTQTCQEYIPSSYNGATALPPAGTPSPTPATQSVPECAWCPALGGLCASIGASGFDQASCPAFELGAFLIGQWGVAECPEGSYPIETKGNCKAVQTLAGQSWDDSSYSSAGPCVWCSDSTSGAFMFGPCSKQSKMVCFRMKADISSYAVEWNVGCAQYTAAENLCGQGPNGPSSLPQDMQPVNINCLNDFDDNGYSIDEVTHAKAEELCNSETHCEGFVSFKGNHIHKHKIRLVRTTSPAPVPAPGEQCHTKPSALSRRRAPVATPSPPTATAAPATPGPATHQPTPSPTLSTSTATSSTGTSSTITITTTVTSTTTTIPYICQPTPAAVAAPCVMQQTKDACDAYNTGTECQWVERSTLTCEAPQGADQNWEGPVWLPNCEDGHVQKCYDGRDVGYEHLGDVGTAGSGAWSNCRARTDCRVIIFRELNGVGKYYLRTGKERPTRVEGNFIRFSCPPETKPTPSGTPAPGQPAQVVDDPVFSGMSASDPGSDPNDPTGSAQMKAQAHLREMEAKLRFRRRLQGVFALLGLVAILVICCVGVKFYFELEPSAHDESKANDEILKALVERPSLKCKFRNCVKYTPENFSTLYATVREKELAESEVLVGYLTSKAAIEEIFGNGSFGIPAASHGPNGTGILVFVPDMAEMGWQQYGADPWPEYAARHMLGAESWHDMMPGGTLQDNLQVLMLLKLSRDFVESSLTKIPERPAVRLLPPIMLSPVMKTPDEKLFYLSLATVCRVLVIDPQPPPQGDVDASGEGEAEGEDPTNPEEETPAAPEGEAPTNQNGKTPTPDAKTTMPSTVASPAPPGGPPPEPSTAAAAVTTAPVEAQAAASAASAAPAPVETQAAASAAPAPDGTQPAAASAAPAPAETQLSPDAAPQAPPTT